jgi:hypothetical protein
MGWRAEARLTTTKHTKSSQKSYSSSEVDIATPHKKEIIMKLSLALLLLFTIFTTHQRPIHGAVVVMVQQHPGAGSSSSKATTPLDLEICNGDQIVHDELTALLADHGARLVLGPEEEQAVKATERSLSSYGSSYGTDHRAKYYRKYVRI